MNTFYLFILLLVFLCFIILKKKNKKEFFENQSNELIWSKIFFQKSNIVSNPEDLTSQNNVLIYNKFEKLKYHSILLSRVSFPYKVIFHFGDNCLPIDKRTNRINYTMDDFNKIYQNKNLKAIWCVNFDYHNYKHMHKIKFLPLGLDFHTIAERNEWGETKKNSVVQETQLKQTYHKFGSQKRELKIFMCNKNNTSKNLKRLGYISQDRNDILNSIHNNKYIVSCGTFIPRKDLWKTFCKYNFVLCPAGNGLDTHRLWESLYLGCIAIVQSCSLDPMMEGFPVVIVKDFTNITKEDLNLWYQKYYPLTQDKEVRKKYESKYWTDKILNF